MLLFATIISLFFSVFFYCQALQCGFGRKRWACAGFIFGPFIWPMFSMKKRMQENRMLGFNLLIFLA